MLQNVENCLKTQYSWKLCLFNVIINPGIDFANAGIDGNVKWAGIPNPGMGTLTMYVAYQHTVCMPISKH